MNTTLNQLTIFIVLGIAADDIFVFCDAWRQSEFIPQIAKDQKRRMAYAFKRSFRAIAVTSSTTAVAFLANAASDIRPIRAFGIYAAIIIPVNFIIVILVIPSVQIIHDNHFKERCNYRKCSPCCRKNKAPTIAQNADVESGKLGVVKVEEDEIRVDAMTRFFSGTYNKYIFKARYVIFVFFFVAGVVAAVIASDIGPLTEQEEFLSNSHPLILLQSDVEENFTSSASLKEALVVKLNWGVKDLDRSNVGLWDAKNLGELVWDEEFTVSPRRNQQAFIDLCLHLRDESLLVKNNFVTCWILEMDEYV